MRPSSVAPDPAHSQIRGCFQAGFPVLEACGLMARPSSRPLRRSRMLARCAAPPPGSWVAAGGRPRPARTPRAPGRWSPAETQGSGPEGGPSGPGAQRPPLGDSGTAAGWAYVSSQPDPGAPRFLPAQGASLKGGLFSGPKGGRLAPSPSGVLGSCHRVLWDVDRSARLSSALCCVCSSSRVRSWRDCAGEQRALGDRSLRRVELAAGGFLPSAQ